MDASFACDDQPQFAKSQISYIICYASCPILWSSKLQTVIATLLLTEAEVIVLLIAMPAIISLIRLARDMSNLGIQIHTDSPTVKCRIF